MAPINQLNFEEEDYQANILSSWLATICQIVGMIVSLLGIKIWWFKHRLTFEESRTNKGAAAGNPPTLKSVTKDKRSSQQVVDFVVTHGVFRKRHEDELDIFDRPKQLPPIRIPERSKSTSNLIPPPRARRGILTPVVMTTPARMQELRLLPPNDKIENEVEPAQETVDSSNKSSSILETQDIRPTNPIVESQGLFRKATIPENKKPLESQGSERRATGFMGPEDAFELDQWIEQVPEDKQHVPGSQRFSNDSPVVEWLPNAEDTWLKNSNQFESNKVMNAAKPYQQEYAVQETVDSNCALHNAQIWQDTVAAFESHSLTQHFEHEFEKIRESYQEHEGHFLELESKLPPVGTQKTKEDSFKDGKRLQNFEHTNEEENSTSRTLGYSASIDEDWENIQQLQSLKLKRKENRTESASGREYHTEMKEISNIEPHSKIEQLSKFEQISKFKAFSNFEQNSNINEFSNTKPFSDKNQHSSFVQDSSSNFEEFSKLGLGAQNPSQFSKQHLLSSATAHVQSIEELYDELSDSEIENPNVTIFEEILFNKTTSKTSILKERLKSFENSDNEAPTAKTRKLKSQQKVTFDFNTEEYYLPEDEIGSDVEDEQQNFKRETKFFYGQEGFQFQAEDDFYDDDDENDDWEHNYEHEMPKMPPPPLPRSAIPKPMQRLTKLQQEKHENEIEDNVDELETFPKEKQHVPTKSNNQTNRTITEESQNYEKEILKQQQTAALLFSSQISFDGLENLNGEVLNAENESQRRYQQELFVAHYESPELKFKPQPSPRLDEPQQQPQQQ